MKTLVLAPLCADLPKTPAAADRAIHLEARPNYHPIATAALDERLLRPPGA
jgi:hypothetical protein